MPVNFTRVLYGQQKIVGNAFHLGGRRFNRTVNVRDDNFADQFGMAAGKGLHAFGIGGFANRVGHVNREEIRRRDETIHGFEPDVVGVHVIRFLPAERLHRRIRLEAHTGWFGADELVFAIRLVPDGNNIRTKLGGQDARAKLRVALVRKTVAHAKRELPQLQIFTHKKAVLTGANLTDSPPNRHIIFCRNVREFCT